MIIRKSFFLLLLFCKTLVALEENQPKYYLSIGAMFRDEGRFLEEWVEYHLMVGVEHFYLYNNNSTDNWKEVLQPYIDRNIVEVIPWPSSSPNDFIPRQLHAYHDCLTKSRNTTTWLALIDLDEFIFPHKERSITETLKKYFATAGAIYVQWHNFGTQEKTLSSQDRVISSLTACAETLHSENMVGKSIVRPTQVSNSIWHPHHVPLLNKLEYPYYNGSNEKLVYSDERTEVILNTYPSKDIININHYCMRGEDVYQKKHARVIQAGASGNRIEEHHESFNKAQNNDLITFIQKNYPEKYADIWEPKKSFVMGAGHCGQLGNQFFQVATTCALAWDNNAEAVFPDWNYPYPVPEHAFSRINKKQPNVPVSFEWGDPSASYTPIPYQPNMKISGYFQSYKYFEHYREKLLNLFAPRDDDQLYIEQKYAWLMQHKNTVGIQLRYYKWEFSQEDTSYPQYGKDYLDKAVKYFADDTLFIISSNNIPFAKQCIPGHLKNVYFIENEQNYIDLYLLSLCRHNIITNSSFGWWAAWLNQNPDKKVVMPKYWSAYVSNLDDLAPTTWIKVEANFNENL